MENEFQRQKRDHDFQTRVLAAVEKPKAPLILKIINSAFFLWCLSALLLTFGGAYYATYQRCVLEADKLAEEHPPLASELSALFADAAREIEISKSPRAAKTNIDKLRASRMEFQNLTLADLFERSDRQLARVSLGDLPHTFDEATLKREAKFRPPTLPLMMATQEFSFSVFIVRMNGNVRLPFSESDWAPEHKKTVLDGANNMAKEFSIEALISGGYPIEPLCSPKTVASAILAGKLPLIIAQREVPREFYETIRNLMSGQPELKADK